MKFPMETDKVINGIVLLFSVCDNLQNDSVMNASFEQKNGSSYMELCINETFDLNNTVQLENWISQYSGLFKSPTTEWIIIVLCYFLIVLVSFFGNSIVCNIIFWNSAMRTTTNIYIGNLSISDLLMTVFNIPLQLTQILSRNWPLNQFLCRCMPFFQGLSVNVSSFTMACIALDRYQVIAYPLNPRPTMNGIIRKIIFIWIMATLASSLYPALADVEEDFTYSKVTRCRLVYPEPRIKVRQTLTIMTMFIQYLGPLWITGFTYYKICYIIWNRKSIGVTTDRQRKQRYMAKWKTIKMLIIVFVVFVVCWFPLNIYHIYQDFRGVVGHNKHNPLIFLFCHWFAMSSVCYNPFVYCWLNDRFRTKAKSYLFWCLRFKQNPERHLNVFYRKGNSSRDMYRCSRKSSSVSLSTQSKLSYISHLTPLCNPKHHDIENNLPDREVNSVKMKIATSSIVKDIIIMKSCIAIPAEAGNYFRDYNETHV